MEEIDETIDRLSSLEASLSSILCALLKRIMKLEKEINDLKSNYKELEEK